MRIYETLLNVNMKMNEALYTSIPNHPSLPIRVLNTETGCLYYHTNETAATQFTCLDTSMVLPYGMNEALHSPKEVNEVLHNPEANPR